jgi:glycogen(starch) synthase
MASRIIVDSAFTYNELKLAIKDIEPRLRVIELGVDESRYPQVSKVEAREKLNISGTNIFTLGRIEKMKGVKVVLEALRLLKRKGFNYLIGGMGGQKRELEKYCRINKLNNVKFLGHIPDKDAPYYLAAADLFIYPELGQPAFGLVAIEAMLQSTPVVGSRCGAIPEVVREEVGWIFERGSPDSLATELKRLLDNPRLVDTKSQRCRQYVLDNFSYDRMLSQTINVYEEISSRRE